MSLTIKKLLDPSRYKTELCNNIIETGKCHYGDKCYFAHSKTELLKIERKVNAKTKTILCTNFHTKNIDQLYCCNYGKRCMFTHETIETKMPSLDVYKTVLKNGPRLPILCALTESKVP